MVVGAYVLISFLWVRAGLGREETSEGYTTTTGSTTKPIPLDPLYKSSVPSAILTAPATITQRAVYDPNACREIWETFVPAQLECYSKDLQQQEDFSIQSSLGFGSISVPNTSYSGTFTNILGYTWSTCDGIPRFRSTGISSWTDSWEEPHFRSTLSFINKTQLYSPSCPANPTCTIRSSDCDGQWSAFAKWTTQFPSHSWNSLLQTNAIAWADHWSFALSPYQRYWARSSLTVLGGCLLEKDLCSIGQRQKLMRDSTFLWNLKTINTEDAVETEKAYASAAEHHATRCLADIGRVAAIYFPPRITSRDICANDFAGTAITLANDEPTAPVTTTLTAISFSNTRTHICPRGRSQTGLECIEADRQLSWSTMYGNWTFTSPSIYLAYDAATMWRGCSQLGSTYPSGGMLALAPNEVKTFRYARVTDYTPPPSLAHLSPISYSSRHDPVDLADLEFPAPAAKYYSDLPFCQSQLTTSECTTSSGTESCVQRIMSDLWTKIDNCTDTMSEGENLYYYNTYSIPQAFTDIDPEWSSCKSFDHIDMGVRDPPIALSIAVAISTPSLPWIPIPPTSAVPEDTPSGVPEPTGAPAMGANKPVQVITLAQTIITVIQPLDRSGLIIGTNSLSVGGPNAVIAGQIFSLGPGGLVMGSKTVALPPSLASSFRFTINGDSVSGHRLADGGLVIGTTTLSVGGAAYTTGGSVISMAPSGPMVDGVETQPDGSTVISGSADPSGSNVNGRGSPTKPSGKKSKGTRLSVPHIFKWTRKIIRASL